MDLVEWLERMAPHGLDNPEPVFRMHDARLEQVQEVGAGRHLRLRAARRQRRGRGDRLRMGERARTLARAGRADLAFVPTRNEWSGEARVQLKLKGTRIP